VSLVKRLLPLAFVLALTLSMASQALADPLPGLTPEAAAGPQAFTCLGKVIAVDRPAGTVTVTVQHASLALQGSVGRSLTLAVTRGSALAAICNGAKTPVTLAKVPVGDLLSASGTINATNPAALAYDIGKACVWWPRFRAEYLCRGTISSVDPLASCLVVQVASGSHGLGSGVGTQVTIDVPASAKVFALQGRVATATSIEGMTAGDRVYITGHADFGDPRTPLLTADLVLVRHVLPVGQVTWFACCGRVDAVDQLTGTLSVTVACGTLAVPDGPLTLATTSHSIIRTLSHGALATVGVAGVSVGESIVASGTIDRGDPKNPIHDIGSAFVWQPAR
jgi:hypothetical protein